MGQDLYTVQEVLLLVCGSSLLSVVMVTALIFTIYEKLVTTRRVCLWSASSVSSMGPMKMSKRGVSTWSASPASSVGCIEHTPIEIDTTGGHIALVGAGPGEVDYLTMQALKYIQSAQVIVCDRLVSADILALVPPHCKLLIANKTKGRQALAQEEINEWCVHALAEGKRVVRLKIGDPNIFGRGGEETAFYRNLGYNPVIVPGISSAFAAPLRAGIPLTLRGVADQIVVATGMGKDFSLPDIPLYREKTTVVLLMATERLKTFEVDFTQSGYPLETPVAVVENATTIYERVTFGNIGTISKIAQAANIKPPAVIIVGNVVKCASFENI
jgi:uroporphyrin-III C-methyltransferase